MILIEWSLKHGYSNTAVTSNVHYYYYQDYCAGINADYNAQVLCMQLSNLIQKPFSVGKSITDGGKYFATTTYSMKTKLFMPETLA